MSTNDCKVLLETCTTRVYAENGFRALNAPVDVSPRRLKRHGTDLEAALEMGALEEEYVTALKPNPLPTAEAIRQVGHQLQDSLLRFVHEFFWFWPMQWGQSSSDEGLQALRDGGMKHAGQIWESARKSGTEEQRLVAQHNLAILWHLTAIDGELSILAEGRDGTISEEKEARVNTAWQYAFKYWEVLCPDEAWWRFLSDRVSKTGDARLTNEFVKRFRHTLPIAFDNINADIAVEMARQGHYKRARVHISIMEQTNPGEDDLEFNFRRIRAPLQERIDYAVKQATQDIQSHKEDGLKRAISLYGAAKEQLILLEVLLKKHDPSEYADAADRVAEAILVCQVAYGNETKDLKKSRTVLANTLKLAHDPRLKQRIEENIKILDEMIKSGMFNLPESVADLVEKANRAAQQEDWQRAVEFLESAVKSMGAKAPEQLRKNLAASLANRGIGKANQGMETIGQRAKELERAFGAIAHRVSQARHGTTGVGIQSIAAIRLGISMGVSGSECARCGSHFPSWAGPQAAVALPNGLRVPLCSTCTAELQAAQNRAKPGRDEIALLRSGAKDLADALRYDPTNDHARKNLSDVNGILSKLGQPVVKVPSPAALAPERRSLQAASATEAGDFQWTPKLVIGLIVAAIIMAMLLAWAIG
jgi:hypothetical protein